MKFSIGVSTLFIGAATAYPHVAEMVAERQTTPDPSRRFNAKEQYVSTTGVHKFVAPNLDTDVRGPCPGLNAMANHGYIPHTGVASHLEFVQGTFEAFGMSTDLSGFLTVLGATVDGNGLTTWSIGGPSKYLPGVPPLIGTPQGISGSHNKYECDVSPGRGDLYTHGTTYELQMDQYQILYDMAIKNGDDIDLPLLTDFRVKRFQDSIDNNPYFFNGPFTGVFVQPAAFTFIYRFMSNKSAEHPQGKLNTDIMNTFFGVHKKRDGSLVKRPGMERFPENWYKRAVGDEYSIPFFQLDNSAAFTKYPQFLTVGGNLGKTGTFTGIDPTNLTNGAYNAKDLSKGHNAACFASQFLHQVMPDAIKCSGVVNNIEASMAKFNKQLEVSFGKFNCPEIEKIDHKQFNAFPGYKQLNCETGQYDN